MNRARNVFIPVTLADLLLHSPRTSGHSLIDGTGEHVRAYNATDDDWTDPAYGPLVPKEGQYKNGSNMIPESVVEHGPFGWTSKQKPQVVWASDWLDAVFVAWSCPHAS